MQTLPEQTLTAVAAVEAAAAQLAVSQHVLRRLRRDGSPTGPAVFDEVTGRLVELREWLAARVTAAGAVSG